jgi:hypothetical protein
MSKFRCPSCFTDYIATGTTPPPGIKWSDGHVCRPILIEKTEDDYESRG